MGKYAPCNSMQCNDGLACNKEEVIMIDHLIALQLALQSEQTHVIAHCSSRCHESMPINVLLPKTHRDRSKMAAAACKQLPLLFSKLKLRKKTAGHVGDHNSDYGNHEEILCFMENSKVDGAPVGRLILGDYENQHNAITETNSGVTKSTMEVNNLKYCKAIVQSLADVRIPHPLGYLRIEAVCGAQTIPHLDSMRGPTVNLVNFHQGGGCIVIRTFPQFKTSVVTLDGEQYIPFDYSLTRNYLVLIGLPNRKCQQELSKNVQSKAIFHVKPACTIEALKPHGCLKCAVVGLKEGLLQTIPLHSAADPAAHHCSSSKMTYLLPFSSAVHHSRQHMSECQPLIREVTAEPGRWSAFYGWRYLHWFKGNPMCMRSHVFCWFLREVPVGAKS